MRAPLVLTASLVLLAAAAGPTRADYVKTSRTATVKELPQRDADPIEVVDAGEMFAMVDSVQQDGYYHVYSEQAGRDGWIYRTFVRRYAGDLPAEPPGEPADPLADRTYVRTDAVDPYVRRHLTLGKPQAVFERAREGYVLAQDGRLKIPVWVQYILTPDDLADNADRTDDFRRDTSIPFGSRSELSDYSGSSYQRGHMAPAADMTRSENVMSESFLLSNMAPQVGSFNGGIWGSLEADVRGWVEQRGALTIITGPVFEVAADSTVSYRTIGAHHVAVPSHFYKIVVDTNDPANPEALAFLLPNRRLSSDSLAACLVAIDEIEEKTGLDFLNALPASVQVKLEQEKATGLW